MVYYFQMRILILGCGYAGVPLGAELVRQGHEVLGARRTTAGAEAMKAAGITPLTVDLTKPSDLEGLPRPFDAVINLVSAGRRGDADAYRQVYLEGTRNLLAWLQGKPLHKFIYTSSTGVYGQTDGSAVKEDSPTQPARETSRVLVATEQLLLAAVRQHRFPAVILRVAGIYGPDRSYWLDQFLKKQVKIEGAGDRLMNMIHRDDLVGVLLAALKSARAGGVYNVVDDEPAPQLRFFRWLAETLGMGLPPFETPAESAARPPGGTNKKVLNRTLKMELGYAFKHPTFRQGYTAEIQRLDQAGRLEIPLEPR
jgi:nucleoside-diphosphate-sugar epimerase